MQCIIGMFHSLFDYYIISFLPNGKAYNHIDSYQGGFFIWICVLSVLFASLLLRIFRKSRRYIRYIINDVLDLVSFAIRCFFRILRKSRRLSCKQFYKSYRNYKKRLQYKEVQANQLSKERVLLNKRYDEYLENMVSLVDELSIKRGYVK